MYRRMRTELLIPAKFEFLSTSREVFFFFSYSILFLFFGSRRDEKAQKSELMWALLVAGFHLGLERK